MKLSYRDRIQAIKFSPLYREDFRKYEKQCRQDGEMDSNIGPPWDPCRIQSKAGKWLCEKWGLQYPIAPDAPLNPFYYPPAKRSCEEWGLKLPAGADVPPEPIDFETMKGLCEKWGLELPEEDYSSLPLATDCPSWMIDGPVYPVSFPTEDEFKNKPYIMRETSTAGQRVITHVNGKLCLLIDTSRQPDMIMDALQEFIKPYAKNTGERKGKGTTTADPWKIYLLYQKEKNLWKITKKLHPDITELPTYNKVSASYYRQVLRAHKKALQMIKSVEEEAGKF